MKELSFGLFVHRLADALERPLPGWDAQEKMTSRSRTGSHDPSFIPEDSKEAGVLVLLYPLVNDIGVVFMKRPDYNGVHSGQISFPGGKREDKDFSLQDTAIRETMEEIGIDSEDITCIGKLSDLYIPPSNFKVTPYVGYIVNEPVYRPDPTEVEEVIDIRLSELLRDQNKGQKVITVHGSDILAPAFTIRDHTIWGATAMILSEFIVVIGKLMNGTVSRVS